VRESAGVHVHVHVHVAAMLLAHRRWKKQRGVVGVVVVVWRRAGRDVDGEARRRKKQGGKL
jgi:hypothetical protein